MKKLLIYITAITAALFIMPNKVEAAHSSHRSITYVSGHTSCGCAIYTKKVFSHYDSHGHAVYRYYRQPVSHHCHSRHNNHYNNHYRHHTPRYHHSSHHYGHHGYNHYSRSHSIIRFRF